MYGLGTLVMNSDCGFISAGLFQTLRPGPASLSDLGSQCTGGQHKFPACGSLCQSEDKVSWLFWSPQCSAPGRAEFGILLCLPLPSSPRKISYSFTTFVEHLLHARHHSRPSGYSGELDGGLAYIVTGETDSKSTTSCMMSL